VSPQCRKSHIAGCKVFRQAQFVSFERASSIRTAGLTRPQAHIIAPAEWPQDPNGRRAGKIVVADDMAPLLDTLAETLRTDGYEVFSAADGEVAMALVRSESPDLVLTDINMPSLNGIDLCRQLKDDPATRLIPVMLLTGLDGRAERLAGIDAGADDFLTKPVNTSELRARVRSLMRLKRFTDELDSAESIIISLAQTVEARDKYTGGHCERMAAYAATLGMHLGLTTDEVGALRRGGYLHDIGKVAIPDSVLQKAGPLTADEFEIVKRHTTIGDRLCGNLRLLRMVRPIVRCHHERADGSGYPDGLAGEDIPLLAQIMGVVDVYDALTTDRPYRPALPIEDACVTLEQEAGRGWRRPDLVREFTAAVPQRPAAATRNPGSGSGSRRRALRVGTKARRDRSPRRSAREGLWHFLDLLRLVPNIFVSFDPLRDLRVCDLDFQPVTTDQIFI
jgi:putative two-component system response regulator